MLHGQLLLMRWVYNGGLILNRYAGYYQFLIVCVITNKVSQVMRVLKWGALLGNESAENGWAAFLYSPV